MEPEDRDFMRELLLRHEKATDAMIRRIDAGTDALVRRYDAGTDRLVRRLDAQTDAFVRRLDAQTEVLRKLSADIDTHRREFVEEMRAQRAALSRVLDRLDEGGSAAGA
jgi:hypothetical protein